MPLPGGRQAHDAAGQLDPSRPIEWHEFPMGHEVCPDEIGVIKRRLHERYR
ncbi:MAG: hypothetical protein MJD61_21510 [Proteobacteria bacterium]|nr:hypothetical protein [Pseudomonadota bacterium]